MSLDGLVQVQKVDPRLAIGIRPCHLPVRMNLQASVGQLEAEIQQRPRNLRFGGQNIHPRFAQIEKDSLRFASIGQNKFHRSLHRDAVSAATLAVQ